MFKHTLALVGLSLITFSTNAALYDRGNGLIYDDVLDITWLQDANYAHTSGYAAANAVGGMHSGSNNIQPDGAMGWDAATTWATQLEYDGYDDWRLPSANLINASDPCDASDGSCDFGYNNTTGELGHMFYNNLGNTAFSSITSNVSFTDATPGGGTVSFLNVQSDKYWYGDEFFPNTNDAWSFDSTDGDQSDDSKIDSSYAWAVRDGDVSPVPIPAAVWFFGSALLGLAGVKRKK